MADHSILVTTCAFICLFSVCIQSQHSQLNFKPRNQQFFLNEIFTKYGHNSSMNFEGFEHLLFSLGLGGLQINDHNLSDHKNSNHSQVFTLSHSNHEHGIKDNRNSGYYERTKRFASDHHHDQVQSVSFDEQKIEQENLIILKNPEKYEKECLSPVNLLRAFNLNQNKNISMTDFLYLCPAIIYEIDEQHCIEQSNTMRHIHADDHDDHDDDHQIDTSSSTKSQTVWLYASVAIIIISLCGLLSVAAVPLMHHSMYHQLLHFLVALAVGTLTGDALLHLIPHSLSSHDHGEHDESTTSVWKGMVVLSGIYFFFIMERMIMIISASCKKPNKIQLAEEDLVISTDKKSNIGEKLSRHQKHDSYGYSHADPNVSLQLLNLKSEQTSDQSEAGISASVMMKQKEANGDNVNITESQLYSAPIVTVVDKSGNHGYVHSHSHSHSHGHSHEVPKSISAMAYMVIMGDGLHNFTDGLAIGAAFAASLTVGLSTSIAVFCHELPHELGDFAVLLKSGMTTRQALFYNFISSICCFVGMLIGVGLGNIQSASNWIFAAAAGMFIYISLVDMVPQLSSDLQKPTISNTLLQIAGILCGVALMLLIALYEHDLKRAMS